MAVNSWTWAYTLFPESAMQRSTVVRHLHEWHEQIKQRIPPGFSPVYGGIVSHRFPRTLPAHMEPDIFYLELMEICSGLRHSKRSGGSRSAREYRSPPCPNALKLGFEAITGTFRS